MFRAYDFRNIRRARPGVVDREHLPPNPRNGTLGTRQATMAANDNPPPPGVRRLWAIAAQEGGKTLESFSLASAVLLGEIFGYTWGLATTPCSRASGCLKPLGSTPVGTKHVRGCSSVGRATDF